MFMKFTLALASMVASIGLATAQVDVNRADSATLDSVKGIGPATAKRILDERSKGGHFKDWPDFDARVKGIGEKSATKLSQAGLTVNGRSISGAITAPSAGVLAPPVSTARTGPAGSTASTILTGTAGSTGSKGSSNVRVAAAAPAPALASVQTATRVVSASTPTVPARAVMAAAPEARVARAPAVRSTDARNTDAKLDDRPPVIDLRPITR